jgi:hypothetical protein
MTTSSRTRSDVRRHCRVQVASAGVGSVPVDPTGDPARALSDFRDFAQYVQSTQAHLNGGEGWCSVRRDYPSPR